MQTIASVDVEITRDAGLDAAAFAAAGRLRVVGMYGVGHDPIAKVTVARGVLAANTLGANARAFAGLAVGAGAAHSGRPPHTPRFRATGRFAKLHGKTALIVGRCAIGRMLAQAFGM